MDVLFELIKDLAASMSLGTFLLVLTIIALASVIIANFIMKNSTKRGGFWSFFKSDRNTKEAAELKSVREQIPEMKLQLTSLVMSQAATLKEMLDRVGDLKDSDQAGLEALKAQLNEYALLKREMSSDNAELTSRLDDIKAWFKMHDSNMDKLLDLINKTQSEIEKIDDYCRTVMPEFKGDHREFAKSIAELSKDIALIERTIQTQASGGGLKLR